MSELPVEPDPSAYTSPLLEAAGGVALPGPDAGIAAHYGDFAREQRALAEGAGIVDRSNRGLLAIPGEDRLSWLHSLTSQHLSALAEGSGTQTLILSPHGHIEHHLQLADIGGTTWADVEPGDAEPTAAFLAAMRFMLRVDVKDESPDYGQLTIAGPQRDDLLDKSGIELSPEPWSAAPTPWGGYARRLPWPGDGAVDIVVPRQVLAQVWHSLTANGAVPAGSWAWEALRIAARTPRLGFETDHRTIPHEVGWLETAVHLDKGCYRGQETVARVHNLGRPPRRLVLLHLDGSTNDLPSHNTDVYADGARIGFVTSSGRHYELGPIALALVKRSTPGDAELLVGEVSAAIEAD
ncbi:MAG: glycine cleavage T C-terminal barrel domain-containing protein [Actinomycetota bacterium]